jgi:ribosomal protein L30/L7E
MQLVILVRGLRNVRQPLRDTLKQIGLTRNYHAVLLEDGKPLTQQLRKVQTLVAWGPANDATVKKLQALGGAPYRLHSPKGGFGGVKAGHAQGGAYGNWGEKINDLVQKMM